MENKIAFFDIDKTIFDTESSGERMTKYIGEAAKTTPENIKKMLNGYKSKLEFTTDFNPNDFMQLVAEETGADVTFIGETLFNSKNFVLYPESLETLNELRKSGFSLGIYSEGVLEWQKQKISLTQIIEFFDPTLTIIERRKLLLTSINQLPNGAMVIDDKKEVIDTLKRLRPDLELIWINRKDDEKMEDVRTIRSLKELI